MRLKLSYGREELISQFLGKDQANVKQVLVSVKTSHPEIYARWCDPEGHLRNTLAVFVNGEHIRYHNGMETEIKDGDEIYIVPLITGG